MHCGVKDVTPVFRFSKQNILMWGIWQGKGKPPFNVYFEPFASEMTHLYQQGTVNSCQTVSNNTKVNVGMIVMIDLFTNRKERLPRFKTPGVFVVQLFFLENPYLKEIKPALNKLMPFFAMK